MKLKIFLGIFICLNGQLFAQKGLDSIPSSFLNAFKFRNIGPACTGGRIVDLAVNPKNTSEYYVAAAYGGVWKTSNAGTSFNPIFDVYGTQSIGCLRLDPNNANTLWVGSGENNNQRSVGYGNGVYLSTDGGKSFSNMGLKSSEHIGMIQVDPRNSNVVYVAAYGPLWKDGGERGLYKTEDGGKTWNRIQFVSDKTGCNEVILDPSNPDIVYASFHQRRRHEWTYLGGGPESALYKSTDAGKTWKKLSSGLPGGDVGRISVTISEAAPDRVYAMVEAQEGKGGMFVSYDKGESWNKLNDIYTAGNYYCEITADPQNADRVFILDTWLKWTKDGGKTVSPVGEKWKHVDNHVVWVNPSDGKHLRVGCDGGLYETFDNGSNWKFLDNLPLTQFYRVTVDNALPFYNIYGGTQDNNTLGGPASNGSANGIPNSDWFITVGGDGFKSQVDPNDPNIVYSQWQYGGLIRFDRKTGEQIDIKPQPAPGVKTDRWNWDAPLLISSHNAARLYFAGDKVYRSDNRGNGWKAISGDLSRGVDRNKLPVMGRVWSIDAVAKNQSTSIYGNVMFLAESALDENLLIAGTDDGLIQITTDGGKTWSKQTKFANVPDMTLVSSILASQFDKNTMYATFDNHRNGDFKPYVVKSMDGGKTWMDIASNLPANGSVKTLVEDYVNKDLLFLGTEFGMYASMNGGKKWTLWNAGLPPIAIKEIAIQKRENDLALATFGRGFAILDNYAPLRELSKENMDKNLHIFSIKNSKIFIPKTPFGGRDKGNKGADWYNAPNPESGAVIWFHLKNDYKTLKEIRQEKEKELQKNSKNTYWPSADSIRLEAKEEAAFLLFVIKDIAGREVRRLKSTAKKGITKLVWDLRYASSTPLNRSSPDLSDPYTEPDDGPFVSPGDYTVSVFLVQNGATTVMEGSQTLHTEYMQTPMLESLNAAERHQAILNFTELRRNVSAAADYLGGISGSISTIKKAIFTTGLGNEFTQKVASVLQKTTALNILLNGDGVLASHEFETEPGLYGRIENAWYGVVGTTNGPTQTHVEQYNFAKSQFLDWVGKAKELDAEYAALCAWLDEAKVSYTPGRKFFLK